MEQEQLTLFDTNAVIQSRPYEVSILEVARKICQQFWADKKLNPGQLRSWMTTAFGGSDAEGKWSWKDAHEAQEAAFVLLCGEQSKSFLQGNVHDVLKQIALVESLGLTHTKRSEESVELQQFSTPPQLAYLAVKCADIQATDLVLEPSAGTGILARLAQIQSGAIVLNELSKHRTAILRKLFPGHTVYSFNAEQIHDYLPSGIFPTVVVMNPPFSASPNINRRNPWALAKHLRSAFQRLAPGGRLVLISAHWFRPGKKEWEQVFQGLNNAYVPVTAWIDGNVYAKHGTNIETRLTVIDKVAPPEGSQLAEFNLRLPATQGKAKQRSSFFVYEVERLLAALPARAVSLPKAKEWHQEQEAEKGLSPELLKAKAEKKKTLGQAKLGSKKGSLESLPLWANSPTSETTLPENVEKVSVSREAIKVTYDVVAAVERQTNPMGETLYEVYKPQRITIHGAKPHPTTLCESAALSSVKPPAVTYQPLLPRSVVEKGLLSEVQLESVIYAGEAHSHLLGGFYQVNDSFDQVEVASSENPDAVQFRQGWFLGDGTGAGKGRQVAGVILDNWNQGRTKALWISKSDKLLEDARRDWIALGGNDAEIVPLSRYKLGEAIALSCYAA